AGHRGRRRRFGGPRRVELIVVCAQYPEQGLELAVGDGRIGEVDGVRAVECVVALESRYVAIAAAVDEEVAVGDDGRAGDRGGWRGCWGGMAGGWAGSPGCT